MVGIILIIIGYLLGSLSSAIIVCKLMKLADPRSEGSGNPGATNMLRMHGKNIAMIVLAGDALKGFIPVILARIVGLDDFWLGIVAFAALVGHVFPIFFQFKGGKGVATTIGGLLGLVPVVGIICAVVWILVAAIFRYSSLASLAAVVVAPFLMVFIYVHFFIPVALMTALVIWKHWDNIEKLRDGTESKLTF